MEILLFWIFFAVIVGMVADSRGRSGIVWCLVAVIVSPLLAGLLVLVLPRLNAPDLGSASRNVAPPEPTKVCPDCAERVNEAARICRFCRHEFWTAKPQSSSLSIPPGRTR